MLVGQECALATMKGQVLDYLKRILDAEHQINGILDENYNKIPGLVYDGINAELHDEERHTVDINGKEIDEMEL